MSIEENGHTNGEMEEVSARHDSTAEQSFDELARGFSTGTVPRRKALRMLAASLFGGALVAVPAVAVAAPGSPKPGGTGCPKPGQIRDPQTGKGQCICGPGFQTCNDKSCIEESRCGPGQTPNLTTCQCECASGKVFCGGRCIDDPDCGADQILVADANGQCSCECRNENLVIGNNGTCECPNSCGPNELQNTTTCACDQCQSGFTRCTNGTTTTCVANCPSDQVLNSNCSCECRNVNQEIVGGQCVCTNTAFAANCSATGGTFNPNTCRCNCPATTAENNQGFCVCPANAATAACTGSGGELDETCGCTCPSGKVLNASGQCECITTDFTTACTGSGGQLTATCGCTCPQGKTANTSGECVCNTVCTGGTVDPATCVCTCPEGQTVNASGQCVSNCGATAASNCSGSGGTFNSTTCVCTCAPPRTTLNTAGECVCPGNQHFCAPTPGQPNGECKPASKAC